MTTFTKEERLLMMLYSPGNLPGLIAILQEMRAYLMPDEKELLTMTNSVLSRLYGMTEAEFAALDLYDDITF